MNSIPNEILINVFSYLDLPSLGKSASVCKNWNSVQSKTDLLWKEKCLKYLEDPKPYHNSFKERYKLTLNWIKSRYSTHTLQSHRVKGYFQKIAILKDNSIIEISPSDKNKLLVKNSSNIKEKKFIDQSVFGDTFCVDSVFYENNWLALDSKGMIHIFDVLTGENIRKIETSPEEKLFSLGEIRCHNNKIFTLYNDQLQILDFKSGELLNKTQIKLLLPHFYCTSNFIVLTTVIAPSVHKTHVMILKTNEIKELEAQIDPDHWSIAVSDKHIAHMSGTNLKIFKYINDDLVLQHEISMEQNTAYHTDKNFHIIENWLLIGKNITDMISINTKTHFMIWDLNSGEQISEFQPDYPNTVIESYTNGTILVTKSNITGPSLKDDSLMSGLFDMIQLSEFKIYNFENQPIKKTVNNSTNTTTRTTTDSVSGCACTLV